MKSKAIRPPTHFPNDLHRQSDTMLILLPVGDVGNNEVYSAVEASSVVLCSGEVTLSLSTSFLGDNVVTVVTSGEASRSKRNVSESREGVVGEGIKDIVPSSRDSLVVSLSEESGVKKDNSSPSEDAVGDGDNNIIDPIDNEVILFNSGDIENESEVYGSSSEGTSEVSLGKISGNNSEGSGRGKVVAGTRYVKVCSDRGAVIEESGSETA